MLMLSHDCDVHHKAHCTWDLCAGCYNTHNDACNQDLELSLQLQPSDMMLQVRRDIMLQVLHDMMLESARQKRTVCPDHRVAGGVGNPDKKENTKETKDYTFRRD